MNSYQINHECAKLVKNSKCNYYSILKNSAKQIDLQQFSNVQQYINQSREENQCAYYNTVNKMKRSIIIICYQYLTNKKYMKILEDHV